MDRVEADGDTVNVAGWATDAAHGRAAERVLLFAGDRLIQAGTLNAPRDDLAQQYGPGVAFSGFEFTGLDAGARGGTRPATCVRRGRRPGIGAACGPG